MRQVEATAICSKSFRGGPFRCEASTNISYKPACLLFQPTDETFGSPGIATYSLESDNNS